MHLIRCLLSEAERTRLYEVDNRGGERREYDPIGPVRGMRYSLKVTRLTRCSRLNG
jgi:hypothetical protein